MIDLEKFVRENGFETASLSWTKRGYWMASVWGAKVGEFGCANGRGKNSANEALADVLEVIRVYRAERAALAAGDKEAKAKRIAAIKAELASLEGGAA